MKWNISLGKVDATKKRNGDQMMMRVGDSDANIEMRLRYSCGLMMKLDDAWRMMKPRCSCDIIIFQHLCWSRKMMMRVAGRLATSTEWRMNEGDGAAFWQPNNPEGFGGGTPPISTELLFCSFYQKENTRDGTSRLEKRKACCKHPRRVLILFPKE